jgi:hypothetical protein
VFNPTASSKEALEKVGKPYGKALQELNAKINAALFLANPNAIPSTEEASTSEERKLLKEQRRLEDAKAKRIGWVNRQIDRAKRFIKEPHKEKEHKKPLWSWTAKKNPEKEYQKYLDNRAREEKYYQDIVPREKTGEEYEKEYNEFKKEHPEY